MKRAEGGATPGSRASGQHGRRAILVLGMHRSGTSAVARVLGLCGAELPRESLPPNEYNETGYWEPEAVVRLHDEFLSATGSAFDDVGALPPGWHTSELAAAHAERLGEVLEEVYGEAPLWVVKDPRLCRLVPLWRRALDRLAVTPLAVLPVRHPLEVAASLGRRDKFSLAKSLLLWLRHFLDAEASTRDVPRSFILYESLLQDWRGVVGQIGRDLAIEWPRPPDAAAPEVDAFLDAAQRHHTASPHDLATRPEVSPWVWTAYQWALGAARGEKVSPSVLDETREALKTADLVFLPLPADWQQDRMKLGETLLKMSGLVTDFRELEAKLIQASDEAGALRRELAGRDAQIAGLESERQRHQAELESERERHQAELESERERHQAELESERERAREDAADWRRRSLALRHELDSIRSSVGWWLSKPLRWVEAQGTRLARAAAGLPRGSFRRSRGRLPNPLSLWLQARRLRTSGLFDESWYLQQNSDVAASGLDPLTHYLRFGAAEGRDPNPVFNTRWYVLRNPDVAASRLNPLLHFHRYGAAEGRDPSPAFDTDWYAAENQDVAREGLNPLAHYLQRGMAESRPTRPAGTEPAFREGSSGAAGPSAEAYVRQVLASPGALDPAHRAFQKHEVAPLDVKAIAFYLPQFHPIPENDEWWGRGFTEWTNVSRAVPQFLGHYQPRLPGELGFYDLRLPEIQRRQVDLARNYGIHGFCFHFYWFGGKRLLERPLDQFLSDPSLDIPYCVCWANENWSRRWDGSENEVLIAQEHSAGDDLALIQEISSLFADPRYLRVDGRPILVVYRVDVLPNAAETAERWRRYCRDRGFGEILLVAAQSFRITDPRPFGFDAAVEFPPHGPQDYPPITAEMQGLNPTFSGRVFPYDALARQYERRTPAPYPLIRAVSPSWDNTPRSLERGTVYHGSTPHSYEEWLQVACRYADEHPVHGEKLVFINAWNEWGEGAYLEPDRRYGYAYLEATRSALAAWRERPPSSARRRRIVLVTHNALDFGAQQNALHMVRALNRHFHYAVDIIDLGLGHAEGSPLRCAHGELTPLFQQEGHLYDFADDYPDAQSQTRLLTGLRRDGVELAICNTTVTGPVAATLKTCGFRVVSLIHELPSLVKGYGLETSQRAIAQHADTIVCGSDLVRQGFLDCCPEASERTITRHQGLYKRPTASHRHDRARSQLQAELGLPNDAKVVLGVGYADIRKGFDTFMRVAAQLARADDGVFVVWLGCEMPMLKHWAQHDAERLGFADRIRLLPRVEDVSAYYAAADLLLLPSREDPFPSVVLESLAHRVPVVAFEGATGATELLRRGCGVTVPYGSVDEMTEEALRLLGNAQLRTRLGEAGRRLVAAEFDWRDYMQFLLGQLGEHYHRVSVVVPNYNYAHYVPSRLESIFAQSYPVHEVLVLDDASTDDSLAVLNRLREERGWDLTVLRNEVNSGSVFQQWLKGAEAARGDILWIAEADDDADPDFVAQVVSRLDDPEVVLAYSQSRQIDEEGRLVAPDYLDYVKDIDDEKWRQSWVRDAREELRDTLVVKNTIPNVSAVLVRREPFAQVLEEHMRFIREFRVAGDYASYVQLLAQGGKVAFVSESLSSHRRHAGGVTMKAFGKGLLQEIGRLQTAVFDAVGATDEAAQAAHRYLRELYEQFGLSENGSDWSDDAELTSLSRHPLYPPAPPKRP